MKSKTIEEINAKRECGSGFLDTTVDAQNKQCQEVGQHHKNGAYNFILNKLYYKFNFYCAKYSTQIHNSNIQS